LPRNPDELLSYVRNAFADAVATAPWVSLATKSGQGFVGYGVMLSYNDVSIFCTLGAPLFFVVVHAEPVGEFSYEPKEVKEGLTRFQDEIHKAG
jgi:hypothetical protein